MEEMLFLQRITRYRGEIDRKTFLNQVNSNWFSGNNALRVFSVYVALDKDLDGMYFLSKIFSLTDLALLSNLITTEKFNLYRSLHVLVVISDFDVDIDIPFEPFCPSATVCIL